MKYILHTFLVLNFTSCASYFTRKSCEATNWFDYGQKVALEGRRLTGDKFILDCNLAEADLAESDLDRGFKAGMQKYCLPQTAYQNGKNGRFLSEEMCVGEGLHALRLEHKKGVIEYCDKSNGYNAGAKGEDYNKICPIELEKSFRPEFNRGRRKYLSTVMNQNQNEIRELDQKILRAQSEVSYKRGLLIGLQSRSQLNNEGKELDFKISKMQSEINSLDYAITLNQSKVEALKAKNRKFEIEIIQLGN